MARLHNACNSVDLCIVTSVSFDCRLFARINVRRGVVPAKKNKIVNQLGFVKTQMEDLVGKLESLSFFDESCAMESLIDDYDKLTKHVSQKIGG